MGQERGKQVRKATTSVRTRGEREIEFTEYCAVDVLPFRCCTRTSYPSRVAGVCNEPPRIYALGIPYSVRQLHAFPRVALEGKVKEISAAYDPSKSTLLTRKLVNECFLNCR